MAGSAARLLEFGGRFVAEAVVGEGGCARVHRARDRRTGALVAVKVLRRSLLDSVEIVTRFEVEAELLESFDHPNILPVIARGRLEGVPWFATTYAVQGSLADQMLRRGRLDAPDLLGYVVEILDALHYLHGRSIVHRDVKPENILLDEDDVAMLCDFGIALAPTRRTTWVGERIGTPSYMPPEQYTDPQHVTPQADLYGAGVTLFTGLTGQTGMLLLVDHLRGDALGMVAPPISAIVDRATSVRAADRYQTAWEMSLDLADVLEQYR